MHMKEAWPYVVFYVLGAWLLSLPVHLGMLDVLHAQWLGDTMFAGKAFLWAGFGPFIAGLFAIRFHRGLSDRIHVLGADAMKNGLLVLMLIAIFTAIGLPHGDGPASHFYGFVYMATITIYALLEEFGWRRYLQNALEGLNIHLKYVLIGMIWWIWHARFATTFDLTLFPLICIGGGYLLGRLADVSRSIMPVIIMHALVILLTGTGKASTHAFIGSGLVLTGWFLIDKGLAHPDNAALISEKENPPNN